MRKSGVLLILGGAILLGIGTVFFLAQGPPTEPPPSPSVVAKVTDVSGIPRAVEVVIQRGADRVLQRERTGFGRCSAGMMGCPEAIELRPVAVFLVRDEIGALHAYIGEDPRNGCALVWRPIPAPDRGGSPYDAVFQDVCHGSIYDRRGQRVGGPSPWNLNQLATEIRDVEVYIDPGRILVGDCPGCPGYESPAEPARKFEWTPWAPIAVVVVVTLGPALLVWRRTRNGALGIATALLVLALASFAFGTIATVAFFWGGFLLLAALFGFGIGAATRGQRTQ